MRNIPLCDLEIQYRNLKEEIMYNIDTLCQNAGFIKGKYLENFESLFISSNEANFGLGCSNGTDALFLALKALNIGKGDEVIIPSHTFIATAEAVCHVGAVPVFSDINCDDYTISVEDIERKITQKTKAIIPVHIYGTPCNMTEILDLANSYNLKIVEDCAQAHFAKYKDKYVGTFGEAAAYSFYPGKNLGAYGDAGFILCKQLDILTKIRKLSDHGRLNKFDHDLVGYNHRMDSIQAAVLLVKMKYIDEWNERRRQIAKIYDEHFKPLGYKVVQLTKNKRSVYHVYNIEVSNREVLQKYLLEKGISTGIHYPLPIHLSKAFKNVSKQDKLLNTENISCRILSLPIYPELEDKQLDYIISNFKNYATR